MARRGARNLDRTEQPGTASSAWREAMAARLQRPPAARGAKRTWRDPDAGRGREADEQRRRDRAAAAREDGIEDEVWIEEPDEPAEARAPRAAQPRSRPAGGPRRARVAGSVANELAGAVGPARAKRLESRLAEAAKAYERDRYKDAAAILRPLAQSAPRAAAVRELYGLTLYRLGRWAPAIKELLAFHDVTGSYDQHPTLADCYRGLRRYRKVDETWNALKAASPSAELVAEGRLVVAGALADRGEVKAAIALLEQSPGAHKQAQRRPRDHHLRLWFALADLYERAGEMPRARELFLRVAEHDPDLYDVADRVRSLA